MKECYEACQDDDDCTAFDLSGEMSKKRKQLCLLFGHDDVIPASALQGKCYKMGQGQDAQDEASGGAPEEEEEEEEVIIDIEGDVDLALLGHGACR